MPLSALPALARTLHVSVEEIVGETTKARARRGPAPKLEQQLEQIRQLPRAQQRFVEQMLDTVIARASRS